MALKKEILLLALSTDTSQDILVFSSLEMIQNGFNTLHNFIMYLSLIICETKGKTKQN